MNMSIYNDTFHELSNKDPNDVCQRAFCTYDIKMKSYILPVWGEDYGIYPHEGKIIRIQNDRLVTDDFFIVFITHYLLNAKNQRLKKNGYQKRI